MSNKKFIKYILFLVSIFLVSSLQAQDENLATHTRFKVSHKFTSKFAMSADTEIRLNDALKRFDRWGIGVGANYKLLPFLRAEAGYEFHYRYRGESTWDARNRYQIGVTLSAKWQQFSFALRERFQQTFNDGDVQTRLRSRIKISYDIKDFFITPYFSTEIYQAIGDAAFWRADRMRYRPGLEMKFNKNWGLDLYYCYQHETDRDRNIIGVECSYNF